MSGTVTLTAPESQRAARLPLSALFNEGKGPGFWTVNDEGALTLKPATILAYETDAVLVSAGPAEGDSVVVLGVQKLDPRQRVRALDKL
jgi:multidrug efflux pump subunit AcrA (membrane-fusion protein)